MNYPKNLIKYQNPAKPIPTSRFNNLPVQMYNENGKFVEDVPGSFQQTRKEPRSFTYNIPYSISQLHNNLNQAPMLWNPERLPEPRYQRTFEFDENGNVMGYNRTPRLIRK